MVKVDKSSGTPHHTCYTLYMKARKVTRLFIAPPLTNNLSVGRFRILL